MLRNETIIEHADSTINSNNNEYAYISQYTVISARNLDEHKPIGGASAADAIDAASMMGVAFPLQRK